MSTRNRADRNRADRPWWLYPVRLGLARGWTEFRQSLRSTEDMGWLAFVTTGFVLVLFFQRNSTVEGTDQSLASVVLPSLLGMYLAIGGLTGAAGGLSADREAPTILRRMARRESGTVLEERRQRALQRIG